MIPISSFSNVKIKRLMRLQQRPNNETWVIEGWKLLKEAVQSNIVVREVYLTRDALKEAAASGILEKTKSLMYVVPSALMKRISNLETPPGVLAVGEAPANSSNAVPEHLGALLCSIRDPGNFGTIVRTAEAAGCDQVSYTSDCVNPHQTKVVRASMGSVFRVPLVEIQELGAALKTLQGERVHLYALTAAGSDRLFDITPKFPAMIVIGSEAQGLPADLPSGISRVSIPMTATVESLNAAVAASVALFHFSRFLPA